MNLGKEMSDLPLGTPYLKDDGQREVDSLVFRRGRLKSVRLRLTNIWQVLNLMGLDEVSPKEEAGLPQREQA